MIITTIQEANLIDCGCCPWPVCEEPQKECESLSANFRGNSLTSNAGIRYRKASRNYWWYESGGSGPFHEEELFIHGPVRGWAMTDGPCGEVDNPPQDPSWTPPSDALITAVSEWFDFANPWSASEFISEIKTHLDSFDFDDLDCPAGSSCISSTIGITDAWPGLDGVDMVRSRYRLAPPASFLESGSARTVYEVEWDEVFFPTEWDEWDQGGRIGTEPSPKPSLVTARAWTWDGVKTDPGRWSPWYNISPPESPGQTRVVNMRVICWRSTRTGTKPTAYGEIYELEEPPP